MNVTELRIIVRPEHYEEPLLNVIMLMNADGTCSSRNFSIEGPSIDPEILIDLIRMKYKELIKEIKASIK